MIELSTSLREIAGCDEGFVYDMTTKELMIVNFNDIPEDSMLVTLWYNSDEHHNYCVFIDDDLVVEAKGITNNMFEYPIRLSDDVLGYNGDREKKWDLERKHKLIDLIYGFHDQFKWKFWNELHNNFLYNNVNGHFPLVRAKWYKIGKHMIYALV